MLRIRPATALCAGRILTRSIYVRQTRHSHSIRALQQAFLDPKSPFHLPAGTRGPESPDDHGVSEDIAIAAKDISSTKEARAHLLELGYDPTSFFEQPIVWGHHDSFQHVNNVHYVRFIESGRIKWMEALGHEIGGPTKASAMLKGKGVSLILKSIAVNYKRPVTYPDTLLIAHKPHLGPASTSNNANPTDRDGIVRRVPKTHFHVLAVAYSYAQQRIVTESDSVLVWYDYDKLAKCDPGEEVRRLLERKIAMGCANSGQQS